MKGPGLLLSSPMTGTERCEVKNTRVVASDYKNCSESYLLKTPQRSYQRQFFHIYNSRLAALKPRVESAAAKKYGPGTSIMNICDLDAMAASDEYSEIFEPKRVVVIGSLFKSQPLKPDILKELSEEQGLIPQPPSTSYVSEKDEIVLEDHNARIRLIFGAEAEAKGFSVARLSTGVVCGVYGREIRTGKGKGTTGGKFQVEDIIFPVADPQPKCESLKEDRWIAFLSGLELTGNNCDILSTMELALSWITGDAGEMADQAFNSNVERLILGGNSLSEETRNKESMKKARYLTKDEDAASLSAVNSLDDILAALCVSINVDIMPGEFDPANQILPQQPLHTCLFPQSAPYPTLQTVSNPYMFEIGGRTVLGTSGQNVDDLLRNTSLDGPLEAMEALLRWSHFAPTCPDTMGCFPFQDRDPFILNYRPHIFFTTNQNQFQSRTIKFEDGSETLLLSVPKFSSVSTIVLLNFRSMECRPINFDASFDEGSKSD